MFIRPAALTIQPQNAVLRVRHSHPTLEDEPEQICPHFHWRRSGCYAVRIDCRPGRVDEVARHRWIATHILPLESQARRWLSRHVRSLSVSDADDLIQEAYSRLWETDFAAIRNPRAYFYAALRNLLLEQARYAQVVRMERMGEIDELRIPSNDPGPERRVGARQELERLKALAKALPAQCRRTFELRKIQGMSQREVAARMGISERTVEKHLAKALDRVLQGFADAEACDGNRQGNSESGGNGAKAEHD